MISHTGKLVGFFTCGDCSCCCCCCFCCYCCCCCCCHFVLPPNTKKEFKFARLTPIDCPSRTLQNWKHLPPPSLGLRWGHPWGQDLPPPSNLPHHREQDRKAVNYIPGMGGKQLDSQEFCCLCFFATKKGDFLHFGKSFLSKETEP